jgi:hypothetical protein
MNTVTHEGRHFRIRVVRRRRKSWFWAIVKGTIVVYAVVVGGATGILVGAMAVNMFYPGHPFYVGIKQFLEKLFL